jgi:topoisomerase IA-like protein
MEIIIIIAVIVGVGAVYFLSRKPKTEPGSASAPYKVEEAVAPVVEAPVVEAPAKAAPAKKAPAKKTAAKKAPAKKTAAKKPTAK